MKISEIMRLLADGPRLWLRQNYLFLLKLYRDQKSKPHREDIAPLRILVADFNTCMGSSYASQVCLDEERERIDHVLNAAPS